MKRTYEVTDRADKRAVAEFLKQEGQFLLPMVELVEQAELAIDEVIEVMGRATIEAVLEMSAEGVAGPKQAGRARAEGEAVWYGRQRGQVYLSERMLEILMAGVTSMTCAPYAGCRRSTWRSLARCSACQRS